MSVIGKWPTGGKQVSDPKPRLTVDLEKVLDCFKLEQEWQKSERLVIYMSVHNILKINMYKCYKPHIVQALNPKDFSTRVQFVELRLAKIGHSRAFVELLSFLYEVVFILE